MGESAKPIVGMSLIEMPRQTCVGCTEYLLGLGMVEIVGDVPMPVGNLPPGSMVARLYRFKEGVTLAECQEAVRGRHRGPKPWGVD